MNFFYQVSVYLKKAQFIYLKCWLNQAGSNTEYFKFIWNCCPCSEIFISLECVLQGTIEIGGVGRTWEIAYNKGRVNLFK